MSLLTELIEKLECKSCGGEFETAKIVSSPYLGVIDEGSLKCSRCGKVLLVRDGILDCSPLADEKLELWDLHCKSGDQGPLAAAIKRGLEKPKVLKARFPVLRLAGEISPPPGSSLELGCGSGAFSLVLKASGTVDDVTLLDYSWKSLLAAKELFSMFGAGCNLVHARLEEAPFKSNAFGLSLSAGVIEHYRTSDERLACLQAHLETGRTAYVQAPASAPGYWLPRLLFTAVKLGWPSGYERPVTMKEMKALLNQSGAALIGKDHQYLLSSPLFTRAGKQIMPGWYTWLFQNEIAVLAENTFKEN